MRRTRALLAGGIAALVLAAGVASPATADKPAPDPASQSLRDLAQRSGLAMGTAVNEALLGDARYREIAASEFSTVTSENAMKWETLEPVRGQYNWAPAEQFMAFAAENGQSVRGHVLVWHNQLPGWLTQGVADGSISDTELRTILQNHITTVVNHFKGRIWQWDVVNEAATDPWDSQGGKIGYKGFWYEHLGEQYVADAFRWARAADKSALLFYNDYNIEAFGDRGPLDKTEFVYQMVKALRAQGVPVDGVGSQAHLSTRYGNYSAFQVSDALERFAALGVATALTEVDVRNLMPAAQTGDSLNPLLQAQAYNYTALLQGCLSSRHCLSYTVWGFDDGHSWTNTWDFGSGPGGEAMAAIYTADYQPKPAYRALQAALAFSGPPLVLPRIPQQPRG